MIKYINYISRTYSSRLRTNVYYLFTIKFSVSCRFSFVLLIVKPPSYNRIKYNNIFQIRFVTII